MFKIKMMLLPLAALLLGACRTNSASTPMLTSLPESSEDREPTLVLTNTSQPVPTLTLSIVKSSPDKPDVDVTHVRAVLEHDGTWSFHVTLLHPDTGWDDYADGWDVVTLDGTVLKVKPEDIYTRLLLHPHENEQPFTRSQRGITIPEGVTQVVIRAHDLIAGFGGQEVLVDLEQDSGPGFEVERK